MRSGTCSLLGYSTGGILILPRVALRLVFLEDEMFALACTSLPAVFSFGLAVRSSVVLGESAFPVLEWGLVRDLAGGGAVACVILVVGGLSQLGGSQLRGFVRGSQLKGP